MMDLFLLCSIIAAGSVRAIVYLFLVFHLLSAKKPKNGGIIVSSFGVAVISVLWFVMKLPDFYQIVLETIWIVFCVHFFQNAVI